MKSSAQDAARGNLPEIYAIINCRDSNGIQYTLQKNRLFFVHYGLSIAFLEEEILFGRAYLSVIYFATL